MGIVRLAQFETPTRLVLGYWHPKWMDMR